MVSRFSVVFLKIFEGTLIELITVDHLLHLAAHKTTVMDFPVEINKYFILFGI